MPIHMIAFKAIRQGFIHLRHQLPCTQEKFTAISESQYIFLLYSSLQEKIHYIFFYNLHHPKSFLALPYVIIQSFGLLYACTVLLMLLLLSTTHKEDLRFQFKVTGHVKGQAFFNTPGKLFFRT